MDAFEEVVCEILWRDGYWVRNAFKVELTKEDKRRINRPSSPRWELDIVAYSGRRNELLVVECKSYLDSPGVKFRAFDGSDDKAAERFKLFNETILRRTVFNRLKNQLNEMGLISRNPSIRLALACGKFINERERKLLNRHFKKKRWQLWGDDWLRDKLKRIAKSGYENSSVAIVAKILERSRGQNSRPGK